MRDLTGISAGRESLIAHGTALNAVADNLANVNTTGFKSERAEFADLVADGLGSLYDAPSSAGCGVAADQISTTYDKQGALDFTGRPLDAAIDGRGFFILNNGTDSYYTRAGNFVTNSEGSITAITGEQLMGYTAASPETLVPLTTEGATGTAVATTAVKLSGNLSADTTVEALPGNFADYTTLNAATDFRSSVSVIDSLGSRHEVSLHFFKTAQSNWTVQAYVDSSQTTAGGSTATPVLVGNGTVTFDATGAQTVAANSFNINTGWVNGANASAVAVDIIGLTGDASLSAMDAVSADGRPAGNASGFQIKETGELVALLDSGEESVIGTVALALFPSNAGLERVGDNRYRETEESGAVSVGQPATDGRGSLTGSALESSNVDPANEFVSMIRYQRGYQAASQVVQAINETIKQGLQIA